jgi:endonuclease/exonuclease/phosphatase family metal-dependent hydrolase
VNGNAILGRWPICAARSLDLSFGTRAARGALDIDVETDGPGSALRVVATHLGFAH